MSQKTTETAQPNALNLALQARYEEIDWANLTIEDLKLKNSSKETLLHHLIAKTPIHNPWTADDDNPDTEHLRVKAQLDLIPKHLICDEILNQRTKRGKSVYLLLAQTRALNLIPKELLTKEILLERLEDPYSKYDQEAFPEENILYEIITQKQLEVVDPKFIEEGILLKQCNQLNTTYLHLTALSGELKKLPKEYWLDKLAIKDKKGNNLLHWAAMRASEPYGDFEDYPINQETIHLMKEQNNDLETPLHNSEDLTKIPEEFIDRNTLYSKCKYQRSALYWTANRNPEKFIQFWVRMKTLKEDTLLEEDCNGNSPLSNLYSYIPSDINKKNLKEFLRMLSTETLKKFKTIKPKTPPLFAPIKQFLSQELHTRKLKQMLGKEDEIGI